MNETLKITLDTPGVILVGNHYEYQGDLISEGSIKIELETRFWFTVSGSIRAKGYILSNCSLCVEGEISAGYGIHVEGKIEAKGITTVEAGITAEYGIRSLGEIVAGAGIQAGEGIVAVKGIQAGEGIVAGWEIRAGKGIKAGWGIVAGLSVKCLEVLEFGHNLFAGTSPSNKVGIQQDDMLVEAMDIKGKVVHGHVELLERGASYNFRLIEV